MKTYHISAVLLMLLLLFSCSGGGIENDIKSGDLKAVIRKLDGGADPDEPDKKGNNMLYYAVFHNQPEIVSYLLSYPVSFKNNAGSQDVRLLAASEGYREIIKAFIPDHIDFSNSDDETYFISKLVANDWPDILQYYHDNRWPRGFDAYRVFDMALELKSQGVIDLLAEHIRNRLPFSEEHYGHLDSETWAHYRNSIEFISQGNLGGGIAYGEFRDHGTAYIYLSDQDMFLDFLVDSLLTMPELPYDEWSSTFYNAYYHNVTSALPEFLAPISRHTGYVDLDHSYERQWLAYLLHRFDRRDYDGIRYLWEAWKEKIYDVVTISRYVELGFYPQVCGLLEHWEYIQSVPGYQDILSQSYTDMENLHDDEYEDYREWWELIPTSLMKESDWYINRTWVVSFWIRRFHEGNHELVAAILREIKEHYDMYEVLVPLYDKKLSNDLAKDLMELIDYGFDSYIKDLVDKGADPELLLDIDGISELHVAVLKDDMQEVEELLREGIDVNIPDDYNIIPLLYARSPGMVQYLINNGAWVNDSSLYEQPLQFFIEEPNLEIVRLLIENGADVNWQDDSGNTPLHYAVPEYDWMYQPEKLQILMVVIEAGGDPEIENNYSYTPLERAREAGNDSVIMVLEQVLEPE